MVDTNSLNSAMHHLLLQTIHLRESNLSTHEDFDLTTCTFSDYQIQTFDGVESYREAKVEDENQAKIGGGLEYGFIFVAGIRLVSAELQEEAEVAEDDVMFQVVGKFAVQYSADNELSKDELEAFADKNVSFNAWPYWREYVQSICGRVGMSPAINVPLFIYADH